MSRIAFSNQGSTLLTTSNHHLLLRHATVKTFEDYDRYLPPRGVKSGHIFDQFLPPEDIREKLKQIRGHLVWFPLEFLRDAEMAERGLQVNALTESVYT